MHPLLWTPSLAIAFTCCNKVNSNLLNLGHSWGVINSGVFFCNNSMVTRVRWAFQVSNGSVETLFRWGGKDLHHFAANLFGKRCAKFHQNCLSFVGDVRPTEKFWSFLLDALYTAPVLSFSNAAVGFYRTELNKTLPQVLKRARFENGFPGFGIPP